ncbi:MAG: FRG domain-containing protein [Firmicutes bacterium]|nr:FRG domain-containing protein [Bacillota bacterium]
MEECSKLITYLGKISKKVILLKERNRGSNINPENLLFAYRGESKDYERTKLMPSLFRNIEYVKKEKYLFELLGDYDVINDSKNRNIERAIEAQHYVQISRMLDITFNVLPSLYFCCKNIEEHEDKDKNNGVLYIFAFPEHYSPHSKYIEEFYSDILAGKDNAYSKNFKVISHSFYNDRLKSQNGGFIFFQGRDFAPIDDIYYETIPIEYDDKSIILKELEEMFAIYESSIFPEKEKRATLIKDKFKSGKYNSKELSLEAEIDTYFERVEYEFEMQKKKLGKEYDNCLFLRKIRKEKADLLSYVEDVINQLDISDEDKKIYFNEKSKLIDINFNILKVI